MQEQAWTRRRLIGHSRPTYDDFHESSYSSGSREAAGAWYLAVLQPAATAERSEAIATRTNSFLLLCHKIRCSHFLSLYIHKQRITGDGGPKMNSISLFFSSKSEERFGIYNAPKMYCQTKIYITSHGILKENFLATSKVYRMCERRPSNGTIIFWTQNHVLHLPSHALHKRSPTNGVNISFQTWGGVDENVRY